MATKKKYSNEELDAMSKEELYAIAQDHEIEGRSTMDKDQLSAALKKHFASEGQDEAVTTPAGPPAPGSKEAKEAAKATEKTDPGKSANENVKAGGHPTGTVPGGTT